MTSLPDRTTFGGRKRPPKVVRSGGRANMWYVLADWWWRFLPPTTFGVRHRQPPLVFAIANHLWCSPKAMANTRGGWRSGGTTGTEFRLLRFRPLSTFGFRRRRSGVRRRRSGGCVRRKSKIDNEMYVHICEGSPSQKCSNF